MWPIQNLCNAVNYYGLFISNSCTHFNRVSVSSDTGLPVSLFLLQDDSDNSS